VHSSLVIIPASKRAAGHVDELVNTTTRPSLPATFDSTTSTSTTTRWPVSPAQEYGTPHARLRLRDSHGNAYVTTHHYHTTAFSPLTLFFLNSMQDTTLPWLLNDGLEFVMVLERTLHMLDANVDADAEEGQDACCLVLALGLDRRDHAASRFGVFCFPRVVWDKAGPRVAVVSIG